jgi:hypothetical protein
MMMMMMMMMIRKDKTSIIKIKCLEQTARKFTAFSDRKMPM